MKTDMSAYAVTELTPEEASATTGGFWGLVAGLVGILVLSVAVPAAVGIILKNKV
ncbi:hypothetical protein [Bradyrhizobium centrolobii]|uniref:hypothetical protein n=1 Tax=Bradyrhizobium centrolobii TaxID=1505087 RepID=UPI000B0B9A7C|nr:hypothetical protein [Bradyrhizobium centrolobii]